MRLPSLNNFLDIAEAAGLDCIGTAKDQYKHMWIILDFAYGKRALYKGTTLLEHVKHTFPRHTIQVMSHLYAPEIKEVFVKLTK